jgi:hypothetical protein
MDDDQNDLTSAAPADTKFVATTVPAININNADSEARNACE